MYIIISILLFTKWFDLCVKFSIVLGLVVTRYSGNFDAETYTIAVPSLQRLTIDEDSCADVDGGTIFEILEHPISQFCWLLSDGECATACGSRDL